MNNLIYEARRLAESDGLLLGTSVRRMLTAFANAAEVIDCIDLARSEPSAWARAIDTAQYILREQTKGK